MIWKIIGNIKLLVEKCKRDNINAFAAQTAFFIILSAIPFLMFFSSLLRYTPVTKGVLMAIVNRAMPDYIAPFCVSIINEVYNKSFGIISVAAVLAIWSAAKGVQYMAGGLNAINGIEETRNWFVMRFWAIVYTIGYCHYIGAFGFWNLPAGVNCEICSDYGSCGKYHYPAEKSDYAGNPDFVFYSLV